MARDASSASVRTAAPSRDRTRPTVCRPVPPTTAEPTISTPRLVALVALALLVVCLVAFAASELLNHPRNRTPALPRHVDRVVVDAGSGDVRLQGGEGSRVVVSESLQWLWRRPTVSMRVVGS